MCCKQAKIRDCFETSLVNKTVADAQSQTTHDARRVILQGIDGRFVVVIGSLPDRQPPCAFLCASLVWKRTNQTLQTRIHRLHIVYHAAQNKAVYKHPVMNSVS